MMMYIYRHYAYQIAYPSHDIGLAPAVVTALAKYVRTVEILRL